MKKMILLFALLLFFQGHAQQPEKQDSTCFSSQYEKLKTEYMNEIKKDSFYVSVPVISKDFYQGTIEVPPGVKKRHFSKIVVAINGEWHYPPFDNEQFEAWMKEREKKK